MNFLTCIVSPTSLSLKMLEECKPSQQMNIHEKGNDYTATTYTKLNSPAQQFTTLNNNDAVLESYSSKALNTATGPCPPEWMLNRSYSEHDAVTSSNTSTIYTCKGYPTTGYCGQSPYEVERGPLYKDAWKEVGRCVNGQMILDSNDEVVNLHMYTGTSIRMIPSPPPPPTPPRPSSRLRPSSKAAGGRGRISSPTAKQVEESLSMAASFVKALEPVRGEEEPEPNSATTEEMNTTSESINTTVCIDGVLYVCTIQDWCYLKDFELKVGRYWTLVWAEHGSCGDVDGEAEDFVEGEGTAGGSSELINVDESLSFDPPCPDETWVAGSVYSDGDIVTALRHSYICKEYPYSQWCGMRGYEPGVDQHWEMAWTLEGPCSEAADVVPVPATPTPTPNPIYKPTGPDLIVTPRPTPRPTPGPTSKPVETANVVVLSTPKPTDMPVNPRPVPVTPKPTAKPVAPTPKPSFKPVAPPPPASSSSTTGFIEVVKAPRTTKQVYDILKQKKSRIDSELFLSAGDIESTVYRYRGFRDGLEVMHEEGVGDSFFYLGDDSDIGYKVGLVNIAAFIAQSMKETIKYDACDENSWDLVDSKYPLSNSCGQLGQSYQDYHCPENERHMECKVDKNMKITATTHANWYGAPAPLFCAPKSEIPFTGFWDYGLACNDPWANPPKYCEVYEGQKGGGFDFTSPVKNSAGRTDVEGCCWWGRGVIQTTGIW